MKNKALEALGRLYLYYDLEMENYKYLANHSFIEDLDTIEKALKDYAQTKPTIDALDKGKLVLFDEEQYKQIKKENKVLWIIKEKKVNLEYLKCCENYEQYKTICSYWNEITQEEYDLLKEVL